MRTDGQNREHWICLRVAQGFGRCHLHRLLLEHKLGLDIAGDKHRQRAEHSCPEPDFHGLAERPLVDTIALTTTAALNQPPATDTDNERAGGKERAGYGMRESC